MSLCLEIVLTYESNNNTGIQKLISAFFQTLKSKNQVQRTLTAQYFESIITKLGLGRALCDIKVT